MSKPMSNTHVTIYIRKMTWLTWVGQNHTSFQGEALFRQRREKGATPRQKFSRADLVPEYGKKKSERGVTRKEKHMKEKKNIYIDAREYAQIADDYFDDHIESGGHLYLEKSQAISQIAIAYALADIRDELRKMNGGDRDA